MNYSLAECVTCLGRSLHGLGNLIRYARLNSSNYLACEFTICARASGNTSSSIVNTNEEYAMLGEEYVIVRVGLGETKVLERLSHR